ncbi:phosphonate C-P lyase system protein PhnG [Desulfocapsa sp. AH-315-G09]|jgi:alpha-D-ribose 1-methylphosphonate 5-triphosphate synthase subunit PhnG|nr:phosphonate C-P lyase system protein PhnG [Desulfocapsa sp.]MBN4048912.1 phosphonate C-P lyase system protein PhnG [bacterium AH-315-N22]MBN4065643.1 phosphonate C-P lyase system protein PhnG [Desulfocapsa sp. AH-315-G09]
MKRENHNFYLQLAEQDELNALSQQIQRLANVQIIQQPTAQTLMLPVDDPVNQGTFYGGEVLVSSAIVQVNDVDGWAMVMDDGQALALSLAILDAAYAAGVEQEAIAKLVQQGRKRHEENLRNTQTEVTATKVSFDLM